MFTTVTGKRCMNPKCDDKGLIKDASGYLCEKCGLEMEAIKKRNPLAVAAVALAGILLMGGVGWIVRTKLLSAAISIGSGGPGGGGDSSTGALNIQYAMQVEGGGRPQIVPANHVFRSGDRLRLLLKGTAPAHYYVFYEDRQNDKIEVLYPEGGSRSLPANEPTAVPPGNGNWLTLDRNPGMERFVIVAAASPVEELDFGGASCSRSRFDSAMEKVKAKYGLSEAKTQSDLEWNTVESKGKGLLKTQFSVQHQ